ncbi:MAG: nuclear transport factor 2 family protein [Xanthomonadales bacterium]|jgi:hypothetical protein|nr:nuclear transport factor 2 family protein [Xanthomonadales bacterium]
MMKKFLLMLSVAWAPLQFAADLESDDAQLRHIKTVLWPQAYRTQDAALLDSLLHESFQLIDDSGRRSTKQQELEWIAANAWNPGAFEFRIERLDIYNGQTAVVAGRGIASDYSYSSSNVLIKADGRWQAVASHVSGVENKPQQPEQ